MENILIQCGPPSYKLLYKHHEYSSFVKRIMKNPSDDWSFFQPPTERNSVWGPHLKQLMASHTPTSDSNSLSLQQMEGTSTTASLQQLLPLWRVMLVLLWPHQLDWLQK